ncbi:unnamed protein product [Prorocentrum cordatum]|uniref:Uncharacterized protein n=2 Tax=Prorocentrum cordatum TaxID=2364126 RepID=A0ABN9PEJ4_9DINO|nr:unnamed protein product [Polarella glacialis]
MALQQELLQRAEGVGPLLRAARGQGEAAWKQASGAQAARLVELVGLVRPQGQLLIRLAGLAQQDGFAPADAQLLQNALATAASSSGGAWKSQDFEHFPYFLSGEVWAVLSDPHGDVLHKARSVLSFLSSKLGLKNPSEGTLAHVTALVTICVDGAPAARSMSPHFLKDTFDHIKTMWKGMVKAEPLEKMAALPADPDAFRAAFPATWASAYGGGGPASIGVFFVDVSVVAKSFKWRERQRAGSASSAPLLQALQNMMGQTLQQPQQERLANGAVLTFAGKQPRSLAGVQAAATSAAGQLAVTAKKAKKVDSVEAAAMQVHAAMQQEKETKAKAKAKAKPAAKTCVLKKPASAPVGKAAVVTKISVENTRSQCVAHYGRGPGSTKVFKWGPNTGYTKETSEKAAKQWIENRLRVG